MKAKLTISYHLLGNNGDKAGEEITRPIDFPAHPPVTLFADQQSTATLAWLEKMVLKAHIESLEKDIEFRDFQIAQLMEQLGRAGEE